MDSLVRGLGGVSLENDGSHHDGREHTRPEAEVEAGQDEAQGDFRTGNSIKNDIKAVTASPRPVHDLVPPGTRMELVCLEGRSFVMTNHLLGVTVRGIAKQGVRIDKHMDYHRVMQDCEDCELVESRTAK